MPELVCDVSIFGGGAAGLWLLDELVRAGYSVILLEAFELGRGQTIASQGIVHGGLKYSLDDIFSPSAAAIRDMPQVWRDAAAGEFGPDLRGMRIRATHCHLWRTGGIKSRLGMIGAKAALRTRPVLLAPQDFPKALRDGPGEAYRLDEQVIDPRSFVAELSRAHADRILKYDANQLITSVDAPDHSINLTVGASTCPEALRLRARAVVLAAGEGNEALLARFGLKSPAMQRRPLHMVMARGDLPELNGHCTDGAKTRVTITSDVDSHNRRVWLIGGQIAEDGVSMDGGDLIRHAFRETREVLPAVDLTCAEWATYRVDRAEPATVGGGRPSEAFAQRQGGIVTAWPTKLALAPELAIRVRSMLAEFLGAPEATAELSSIPADWPRPTVALPPWEMECEWRPAR